MTAATKLPVLQHRVLGEFVLGELLDEGGFGTVYRAEQKGLGRPAVVKVIRRSLTTKRETVERFALEARLASRFDHPYAAHIYAFGVEADGLMWIAMEMVKGTPLHELLRRSGPLPLERFVPLFERLCEVVQSAHDQGIVHRDIKPSNVMVISRAGRLLPKLLDFGIAKSLTAPEMTVVTDSVRRPRTITAQGALGLDNTVDASSSNGTSTGSLTQQGQVLGSPVYMAPEQWLDAASAGPAADQYALALLAYEALSGTRAYQAGSVEALAYQHLEVPIRALPGKLPARLNDVLLRATAKTPDKRYANLHDLAAALRAAAGIATSELDEPIPALPAQQLSDWVHDAPRPLAEALAALGSARTATRADERITAFAALVARWLGVVAIACRSKQGSIEDASVAVELLRALRRRPLLDTEWLELAVALARSRDHFPVPELAGFVADDEAIGKLRTLLRSGRVGALDDTAGRRALEQRIAELAAVLDALAWLLDYSVAREVKGGLELWMGQRTEDRPVQRAESDGSGAVVLLDGYVGRLVRLSPLFEVAVPTPGEAEELFVFAGVGRTDAGARCVSEPRGFERDDDRVWPWLAAHVLETAPEAIAQRSDETSPYPGLSAFSAGDHESFVGRERDVEELLNRLRTHSLVTVVGPSGIGKTSFLAAGVVPGLGASWTAEILRPGNDPLGMLGGVADRIDAPPYREGSSVPATTPVGIAGAIAALAERRATNLLLIVDQAEELFTMCVDAAARDAFAEAIVLAAEHPRVRVVITMRDDFLVRADQLAAWRGRITASVQLLQVPGADDIERMIVVPARRRGYDFDDPKLPAAIAAEVADRPGALPLVAFAAAKLWELRDRHFCRLTRVAYTQIGGVTGALVRHADGIVDRMPAPDRRLVRLAFRRLLSAEGTRALIGRAELEGALGSTPAATAVIDRLLAARLLVSRDDDAGDRIEIIHETLATTWPRLAAWRTEDAAGARLGEQLAVAARHWNERARPAELLWRGAALADLVRRQDSTDATMTELEQTFASASIAAAARTRRRRGAAVASGFGVLASGVVGLVVANAKISDQRTAALERLAANFEERGRLAVADGDDSRGMLYLAEASRLGAHGPGFDLMTSKAEESLDAGLEILGHHGTGIVFMQVDREPVTVDANRELTAWRRDGAAIHLADDIRYAASLGDLAIALSTRGDVAAIELDGRVRWRVPKAVVDTRHGFGVIGSVDKRVAVTYGQHAQIWDVATGRMRAELNHAEHVRAIALDATATRVATGDAIGGVRVWDAATGALLATCPSHAGVVRALAFAPDGKTLVSGAHDGDVRVCDVATGAQVYRLVGHSHEVVSVDISPDGAMIVSAGRDGKPRLWDAHTGMLVRVLEGHTGLVLAAKFSPDGSRIATFGNDDGTARLWNREGMALGSLQGTGGLLSAGDWDRDGHHVVTAGADGAIRRWDADLATQVYPQRAHAGAGSVVALSHDDRWLLTGGADAVAVLWDARTRQPTARLANTGTVSWVAFAPDASSALTLDASGTARLWRIPDGSLLAALPATTAATYANDGTVITAGDGRVRFWSATGAELGAVPLDYTSDRLVLDPTGRWLFARGDASHVLVIDVEARTAVTHLAIRDKHSFGIATDRDRVAITDGMAIRTWQLGSWIPTGELHGHRSAVGDLWFISGGRIVSIADDAALVWGADGTPVAPLTTSRVSSVEPSDDGRFFATASNDGAVRIWDAETYHQLLVLPSHALPAYALAVSHDNAFTYSVGADGRLVVWSLRPHSRTRADLAQIVRCRVPFRLEGDVAVPRDLDFDDPACR